jgi:hypothetical protein
MFILLNAAPDLDREELLERLRELFTAFHADGMCERDDDDAVAMRQLNTAWSQRYLPLGEPYPSLYVIKAASTGYYKVGRAINPSTRVRRLQTRSPFDLEIVHTICGEDEIEASRLERRVHELLDPHHFRGEWFDCSLDQIMAAIALARTE